MFHSVELIHHDTIAAVCVGVDLLKLSLKVMLSLAGRGESTISVLDMAGVVVLVCQLTSDS